ncbi:hypothetical protein EDC01DRAFT_273900 [Geopyxis carbonaria]|nr:hypothetical protein EDC01DRAFT_273900 [Geopyxis carbonaria]
MTNVSTQQYQYDQSQPFYPPETVTRTYSPPSAAPPPLQPRRPSLFRWIILYGVAAVLPMALMVSLLLGLVFRNRTSGPDSGIYYIDYSASDLLTVSSWCATLGVLISGFVMLLFSYTAARSWYVSSSAGGVAWNALPTPLQLALEVQIVGGGGVGALWKLVLYAVGRERAPLPRGLSTAGLVLGMSLILGWGITAADTWLHIAASTGELTTMSPIAGAAMADYGRGLNQRCMDWDDLAEDYPCNLNPAAAVTFLMQDSDAIATAFNTSSNNTIIQANGFALLVPPRPDPQLDYTAGTYALKATCKPISRACNLEGTFGIETKYDCEPAGFSVYKGNLENQTYYDLYPFANDSSGDTRMIYGTPHNPFRFGASAYLASVSRALKTDPEIVSSVHGTFTALFDCSATVYTATYTMRNSSLTNLKVQPANATLTRIVSGVGSAQTYWGPILAQAMLIAGTSNSSKDMAASFAASFARTFLAFASATTSPRTVSSQSLRSTRLVARFPRAPFWCLTILCILYTIFATGIWIAALLAAGRDPQNVAKTQMRLSVEAVTARALEPRKSRSEAQEVGELFEGEAGCGRGWGGAGVRRRVIVMGNEVGGMDVHAVSAPGTAATGMEGGGVAAGIQLEGMGK